MAFRKYLAPLAGLAAFFSSGLVQAEYNWNFPEPVTPLARDTLHIHNEFMVISIIIFLAVLGIMIY